MTYYRTFLSLYPWANSRSGWSWRVICDTLDNVVPKGIPPLHKVNVVSKV